MPRRMHLGAMPLAFLTLLFGFLLAESLDAASDIVTPSPPYQAADYFTDADRMINSFDVLGNQVAVWGSNFAEILDRSSGSVLSNLDRPVAYFQYLSGLGVSAFNSFTAFDPSGNSVWVGFTTTGNVDDRIFEVTYQGGTWTWNHRATLAGNFELEFSPSGQPFISANPGGMGSGNATLYLLDTTGANQHDPIALVGGYPAGLAFDAAGNLYYATDFLFGPPEQLVKYTAAQVAGAIGPTQLTLGDAAKLADLEYGAYDTEVDAQGRVLFTINAWGGPNLVEMWNGTPGSGYNYSPLAHGTGQFGNFLTFLRSAGDFTAGGVLYVADGWQAYPGVAGIFGEAVQAIPEPSTLVLLLAAAAGLAAVGRYWR